MPKSKPCVVLKVITGNDSHTFGVYPTCDEPTVGERGGFPMCEYHMEMFAPDKENNVNSD